MLLKIIINAHNLLCFIEENEKYFLFYNIYYTNVVVKNKYLANY